MEGLTILGDIITAWLYFFTCLMLVLCSVLWTDLRNERKKKGPLC